MQYPKVLSAFSTEEYARAHVLLASIVATMMGRKLEEGDWSTVYCAAKNIPNRGWSNLNIDIMHQNLGVEHKMLRAKLDVPIRQLCGTRLMHPSATRSIRIPQTKEDPTEAAREVLTQYGELIEERRRRLAENAPGLEPDLRTGWLLWQDSLREFLYFEEEALVPNPNDYWAEWRESGGGTRKASRNLWIYESETGRKRYSITTEAGAKIQPYFDVPPPNEPNLYYFCVQGENVGDGLIRIWVTTTTALLLNNLLGSTDTGTISSAIVKCAQQNLELLREPDNTTRLEEAKPIIITREAYIALSSAFPGVSDEHMIQLFARCLAA